MIIYIKQFIYNIYMKITNSYYLKINNESVSEIVYWLNNYGKKDYSYKKIKKIKTNNNKIIFSIGYYWLYYISKIELCITRNNGNRFMKVRMINTIHSIYCDFCILSLILVIIILNLTLPILSENNNIIIIIIELVVIIFAVFARFNIQRQQINDSKKILEEILIDIKKSKS